MTATQRLTRALSSVFQRYEPLRFVIVGALNTAFSYGLFALFLFTGIDVVLASLFSLLSGILFSFTTQGSIVFGNSSKNAFVRFSAVWFVIYCAYLSTVKLAELLAFNNYIGGLIATPVVACLSYFLQRQFVFRPDRSNQR